MDKVILRINNDFSYLLTKNQALKDKLWNVMRFRQRNYFHSTLYRQKIWDGYIDFFNKMNGRFLTGLLVEIKLALHQLEVSYEIVDERQQITFLNESIDNQFLNQWLPKGMKPIILEDYQVDLVNQALKYHRGIVKSPPGSGKTYVALAFMKCLPPGTPTLFLANRKSIIKQNYKEMLKWGFKNVGLFDGNHHEPNIITCSTVQSLHHLDKVLHKFRAVIVDEIHMMMGATAIKVYKKLKGASVRIAVSGTPFKYEQKKRNSKESIGGDKVHKYGVKGYFGPVFKTSVTESGDLTTDYMKTVGRCSESRCIFHYIDEPQGLQNDIYFDAVTAGIAQSWHFHQVVSKLAKTLKGRTLILVERLAHGDMLQQLIPNSLWVQGKDNDDTRQCVIDQLQTSKGDVTAIASIGIFNTGLNFYTHQIINAAGGAASHEIIQRIGRGLRPAGDKEILTYYDFIFRINHYLENHSNQRVRILRNEGHEVIIKPELDF